MAPVPGTRSSPEVSRVRFFAANLLGHIAAAYGLSAIMLLAAGLENLVEPGLSAGDMPSLSRLVEGVLVVPVVVSWFALMAAVLLIPYSMLGTVMAWSVVTKMRTDRLSAVGIGGLAGVLFGEFSVWRASRVDGLPCSWMVSSLALELAECAAGCVYGWVV